MSQMDRMISAMEFPSGCMNVGRRVRKVRRPEPTGAADLDLDALISSGALEDHRRRSLRRTLTDLLTWLRAPNF